jgi:hypothetical protein
MKWYIGQEIVAIDSHEDGHFRKGDTFIIKGLQSSFCKCHSTLIDINMKTTNRFCYCGYCNVCFKNNGIAWFSDKRFTPIDYDISELTDILEKPIELNNK